MELRLLSVNVARPRVIGERDGQPVLSAFEKKPISAAAIMVGATDLDGDEQANLAVHGGLDKAVYAYPADHWPWWEGEKRFACKPGSFGENLTLSGADETQIHIGDRFAWGDAVLEVSQPRAPCHKFQTVSGREDASALMVLSGRCGWYYRVLVEGVAPAKGGLIRTKESGGPSVREMFIAGFSRRLDDRRRRQLAMTPGLASAWAERFTDEA